MEKHDRPKRKWNGKVTFWCGVAVAVSTVFMARNNFCDAFDWIHDMAHLPATEVRHHAEAIQGLKELRADMLAGFKDGSQNDNQLRQLGLQNSEAIANLSYKMDQIINKQRQQKAGLDPAELSFNQGQVDIFLSTNKQW